MIELKKIKPLESKRLTLRGFCDKDAEMLFNNWGKDESITKFMLWRNYKTIDDAKKSIYYYKQCYENNDTFRQYAIELKNSNEIIGQISFNINKRHHNAEIAYILSKKYWNNGYMTEAINTLNNYLFNELNCMRVSAEVMIDNKNSIDLLERCNFVKEGIERKKYVNKENNFTDVIMFSLINDNFEFDK